MLITEKVTTPVEYLDYTDVFSKKSAKVLPECTKINKDIIKLVDSKQLPYMPIYNLELVKLKTLKTYIEINLANEFLWLLKFLAAAFILLVHKPDGSLYLYVDYQGLNNSLIKN